MPDSSVPAAGAGTLRLIKARRRLEDWPLKSKGKDRSAEASVVNDGDALIGDNPDFTSIPFPGNAQRFIVLLPISRNAIL
jgi:hypothetical protein